MASLAGDVGRVTLVIISAPVFTLLLLRFVFRTEHVTARIAAGAALAMAGVVFVAAG